MNTIVKGWQVDSNVTLCLVQTGLPFSLLCFLPSQCSPSQVKVKGAHTELGAAISNSGAQVLCWWIFLFTKNDFTGIYRLLRNIHRFFLPNVEIPAGINAMSPHSDQLSCISTHSLTERVSDSKHWHSHLAPPPS